MDGDALRRQNMSHGSKKPNVTLNQGESVGAPANGGFPKEVMADAQKKAKAFSLFGRKQGFEPRGNRTLDDSSLPNDIKSYLSAGDTYDFSVYEQPNDNIIDIQRFDNSNGVEDSFMYDRNENKLFHKDSPFYSDGEYLPIDLGGDE